MNRVQYGVDASWRLHWDIKLASVAHTILWCFGVSVSVFVLTGVGYAHIFAWIVLTSFVIYSVFVFAVAPIMDRKRYRFYDEMHARFLEKMTAEGWDVVNLPSGVRLERQSTMDDGTVVVEMEGRYS